MKKLLTESNAGRIYRASPNATNPAPAGSREPLENTKMKIITTHADLIELFNEDTTRELHLHMERDGGTRSVSFFIATEAENVAQGVMNTETNDDAEYTDELAWAILDDCYDGFVTVTEYDSLVAGTNPGNLRA